MRMILQRLLPTLTFALTALSLAAAEPASKPDGEWRPLFDGKTLKGWKKADFSGTGAVFVTNGTIVLKQGYMTGIVWTNPADLVRMDYEISLEAKRTEGSDFFCGLTVPVGTNPITMVVGGWGGGLVGLSSLDGEDAANNETSKSMTFEEDRWYRIRLQVRPTRILGWIDDEKIIDVETEERRIGIRMECEPLVPLGIGTYSTTGVLRDLKVRKVTEPLKPKR